MKIKGNIKEFGNMFPERILGIRKLKIEKNH